MSNLKPCPFCGASVGSSNGWGEIGCSECGATISRYFIDTKQDAIDAWNTRYERVCKLNYEMIGDMEVTVCSSCRDVMYWDCGFGPKYCPNCGAKVVEEAK